MSYGLVLIDVDGTLVDAARRVNERTRAAIGAAVARGWRVSLATGRTFSSALPYASAAGVNAPLVTYNGARLQDHRTGEVLREWRLDSALAAALIEASDGWDVHLSVFQDDDIFIRQWTEYARASAEKDGVRFTVEPEIHGTVATPPIKLMFIGAPQTLDALDTHLRGALIARQLPLPAIVRSEPNYLEVWSATTSKGNAAAALAESLGVPLSGLVAFGDSYNDLELLTVAGLGVAMGNAPEAVRAVAKRVAPRHDEDGVAKVLEELLRKR